MLARVGAMLKRGSKFCHLPSAGLFDFGLDTARVDVCQFLYTCIFEPRLPFSTLLHLPYGYYFLRWYVPKGHFRSFVPWPTNISHLSQLDKLVGVAMLVAATVVFLYYTFWTLFMVRF